jgi:hypothetical protein
MREENFFKISEPPKLYELVVKTEKYIQSQNTLNVLAYSEAKKMFFLCVCVLADFGVTFDHSKNLKCIYLGPWAR